MSLHGVLVRSVSLLALCACTGALAGCAAEGTTPTCENNVTEDGMLINATPNPCNSYGQCVKNGEVQSDAKECCVDEKGKPLMGYSLKLCLYGFGEVDLADDKGGGKGGSGGAGGKP